MDYVSSSMYSKLPNLVIGFHGCNEETFDRVLYKHQQLNQSTNEYDWLGNGIYFWENSYQRAYEWAKEKYESNGRVIGAVLDLGFCLNLTDYNSTAVLKNGYELLVTRCSRANIPLPKNKPGGSKRDLLVRNLDCAVIQQIHDYNKICNFHEFDSVRGVFTEGEEVYPNAGFVEKTHIQICIVNPNCIKGYFKPISFDENYVIP